MTRNASVMYAAFECAVLAQMAEKSDDHDSYLILGIEAGYGFFAEASNVDFTSDEVRSGIPVGVLWNMNGPNADFMMGRIYASVAENVIDGLGFYPSDEAGRAIVSVEIAKRNCDLLVGPG